MIKNSTLTYLIKKYSSLNENKPCLALETELEDMLIEMDCEDFTPSQESINSILDFAASYEVLETEHTGLIEMILN